MHTKNKSTAETERVKSPNINLPLSIVHILIEKGAALGSTSAAAACSAKQRLPGLSWRRRTALN